MNNISRRRNRGEWQIFRLSAIEIFFFSKYIETTPIFAHLFLPKHVIAVDNEICDLNPCPEWLKCPNSNNLKQMRVLQESILLSFSSLSSYHLKHPW